MTGTRPAEESDGGAGVFKHMFYFMVVRHWKHGCKEYIVSAEQPLKLLWLINKHVRRGWEVEKIKLMNNDKWSKW